MQSLTIKDLMVPKNQYATITADRTLRDAVLMLQEAQRREQSLNQDRYRDRAILAIDEHNAVIGKLSMLDLVRGLLPKYGRVRGTRTSSKAAARVGSARLVIDSQEKDLGLWKKPLTNLIDKASNVKVQELIRPFLDGETVDEEETLDRALNQMITGRFQSLLVTRNGEIVGILRLTDVYEEISRWLREQDAE